MLWCIIEPTTGTVSNCTHVVIYLTSLRLISTQYPGAFMLLLWNKTSFSQTLLTVKLLSTLRRFVMCNLIYIERFSPCLLLIVTMYCRVVYLQLGVHPSVEPYHLCSHPYLPVWYLFLYTWICVTITYWHNYMIHSHLF